ncbi:Uncharacterised protein [Chryseobacterium gleum]|jgi:hypothetical protein|uniref:Lipoprotein n=2 Tax=Chryseobacterium gleum TaxID=250 RepID=A0A448B7U6_CHRGE|nr:hypothetical protein [Chryseobacterium gleum]EFK36882.1 hypothetical protein HMPREF0204_11439 [Chryseobacterium gleum ATCC 35910]MCD9618031.1 hypothetical protein [Chryseobacterium gleum]QBJ88074.1 hypothetical protein DDI74_18295 [Chryseobacterium gleum]QQY32127.1 hypothetical protein I6I60_25405 [Chryseobacterium gleum]VEE10645.1 Uncharacterised protein [Chryseobacterium gleum]
MKKIIFLALSLFFYSCSSNTDEILGKYEYKGKQTLDSIIIEKNVYIHKIYNKQGKLMYQGNSTWELNDNRIIFYNFYNNEDYNLTDFLTEEQAKKFLIRFSCPIYNENKQTVIQANSDQNILYYKN